MPLWLEHLLRDPGLGLTLVGGHAGVRARQPIRWAHISELPDPTPWLEGGEMLLTTGLTVRDSPAAQRRLIAGLHERGCAGVGFGVGVWLDHVPDAMVEEANVRHLPLFTVPYEVPFIAVTKRVSHHIFEEHYATLRSAVELHRQILGTVLAGAGIEGVVETFSRALPHVSCLVYDYFGQLLQRSKRPVDASAVDAAALWPAIADVHEGPGRFEGWLDGRFVLAAPVRLGDQVEAVLTLVGDRELVEHEQLLLEQALTGVSLELARGLSLREARRSRIDELLDDVAEGTLSGRSAARQFGRLGLDVSSAYHLLCVRRPQNLSDQAVCALVEDATSAPVTSLVGRHGADVYCIASPPLEDHAERIASVARARGWEGISIGRSRVRTGLEGLPAAFREAQLAARTTNPSNGSAVHDVTTLGLPGLLAGIDDALGAAAFVKQTLGPVLDYDEAENSDLVESLRAYLRHGCRPGPAAADLHVHRHTLTYRLDRITSLTGRNPRDGANLLPYGLALELALRI